METACEAPVKHYDQNYFAWQKTIGAFGGWANKTKFEKFIKPTDHVIDFGCGGGYLLKNFDCKTRTGIEINTNAHATARQNGVTIYGNMADVPDNSADVIVSNHALEHCEAPLNELRQLYSKLKPGGKIIFVVPCETYRYKFRQGDINQHIYTWSPMCLGNLFQLANFKVITAEPYMHKWPPFYQTIAKIGGRPLFDFCARIYARIERTYFQVRVIATKN